MQYSFHVLYYLSSDTISWFKTEETEEMLCSLKLYLNGRQIKCENGGKPWCKQFIRKFWKPFLLTLSEPFRPINLDKQYMFILWHYYKKHFVKSFQPGLLIYEPSFRWRNGSYKNQTPLSTKNWLWWIRKVCVTLP